MYHPNGTIFKGAVIIPGERRVARHTRRSPGRSVRQPFKLPQQRVVVRYADGHIANDAGAINDVSDATATVLATDGTVTVTEQWIADPVLSGESPVGFKIVTTDAQNLGIERFEAGYITLKRQQFSRSDRGEVRVVKGQHDRFLPDQLGQVKGSMGRRGNKLRRPIADPQGMSAGGTDQ